MPEPSSSVGPSTALTAVDLFCGAGGFTLGLERAGFDVLLGIDSWQLAVDSYAQNFTHPVLCADLATMTGRDILRRARARKGEIDLVVGGPPCQGFSIQRIGADHDLRNSLVLEYARLLREVSPRLFIMENVLGLMGKRGKELFNAFLASVGKAGFDTAFHVVNAADYGVPQLRRRVVVLGWRRNDTAGFELPKPSVAAGRYVTVFQAIGDLPPPETSKPRDPLHKETRLSDVNKERLRHIPEGGGMEDLPVRLRVDCHKAGADKIGHRYVYGRLAAGRPAGTITARFDSFTRGRFAHPYEHRNITLREGARLQTFPDSFGFSGNQEDVAAQIGNAVPPALAEALARSAARSLRDRPKKTSAARTRSGSPSATFNRGTIA